MHTPPMDNCITATANQHRSNQQKTIEEKIEIETAIHDSLPTQHNIHEPLYVYMKDSNSEINTTFLEIEKAISCCEWLNNASGRELDRIFWHYHDSTFTSIHQR